VGLFTFLWGGIEGVSHNGFELPPQEMRGDDVERRGDKQDQGGGGSTKIGKIEADRGRSAAW